MCTVSKKSCGAASSTTAVEYGGRVREYASATRPKVAPGIPRSADACKEERPVLLEHLACDHEALDLVRAFVDLRDLRVAHHALDRVFLDVAVPAQHLHRVRGHVHRDVGAIELRHRR